jgi:hypothetical protein
MALSIIDVKRRVHECPEDSFFMSFLPSIFRQIDPNAVTLGGGICI